MLSRYVLSYNRLKLQIVVAEIDIKPKNNNQGHDNLLRV